MSHAEPGNEAAFEPFVVAPTGVAEAVRAVVEPALAAEGCELVKLEVATGKRRVVVRLFVDLAGPDEHIEIGTLTRLNRMVGDMLEVEDTEKGLFRGEWELEVSSPGVDRPLTKRSHFPKALGEQVKVKTRVAVAQKRTLTGTLIEADDEGITCAVDDEEEPVRIGFENLEHAHTIFQFAAPTKAPKKKGGKKKGKGPNKPHSKASKGAEHKSAGE